MKTESTEHTKERDSQKQIVVSFTTSADLIQRVKLLAIQKDQKLKDSFREALEDWIKKNS